VALVVAQIAFATTIVWALTSPTWQVRYVRIVGTDDARLTQTIEALPLTGCNIFRCDTQGQVRQVERLPLVASVQIHAAYPDGLIVEVEPRHPALLWHVGGTAYVVASDGTVLGTPNSDPAFASAALQDVQDDGAAAFSGQAPSVGTHMPAAVADMARQLRSGLPAALGSNWTLRYTASQGFVAVEAGGARVVFGTPDDAASAGGTGAVGGVATQIDELRGLLAALAARGEQPAVIDLRWGGHPYYRLTGT
jgi:hypothetical protein